MKVKNLKKYLIILKKEFMMLLLKLIKLQIVKKCLKIVEI